MGDFLNNFTVFKKLGFDSSNQWIFYEEDFKKFFSFIANNTTDANLLTEQEVLEHDEMLRQKEWLDETERDKKLQQIGNENPNILTYTNEDVAALSLEIELNEGAINEYTTLIEDMRHTKHSITNNLVELEHAINVFSTAQKEVLNECQNKAKELEELQSENCKLCAETTTYFIKLQSPPLFMHQLPLEQYILKCESFMQYFTLYMHDNFKIQDCNESDSDEKDSQHISNDLEELNNSIKYYTVALIKEQAKAKGTQALIDNLDVNQVHCIRLNDMMRETHELEILNDHHLKNAYETLLTTLEIHVHEHTHQRMELVLYENTKEKLARALKRSENSKNLTRMLSDALSNAELIWIAMQMDLEKKRNRIDNIKELNAKAQSCGQRIQFLRTQNAIQQAHTIPFVCEIATHLGVHLQQRVKTDAKNCLYEYEKFDRLLNYAQQNMLNNKTQTIAKDQLNKLKHLEQVLMRFVYDSPLEVPMFENVRFLKFKFNAAQEQQNFEKVFRKLRTEFATQISDRMERDKLWRYSRLLWIYFLTEPQLMLHAIEEVEKAAKIPLIPAVKALSGIKRK